MWSHSGTMQKADTHISSEPQLARTELNDSSMV